MSSVPLVEIWRGPFLESVHRGHAVVCDGSGQIVDAWGDPAAIVLPRSSSKMIQALPLVESGAAAAAGLGPEQLALSCASHNGAAIHTQRVSTWLAGLGLGELDLRCGTQVPVDPEVTRCVICEGLVPDQTHNNCSGKHSGFLTLNRHLGGGPEYVEPDHPVQQAVRAAWEDVTGEPVAGYGIDGCSAPNFASSVAGMARAMAGYAEAAAGRAQGTRAAAQSALVQAMMAHPDLVAGEGRACTRLMRAMGGKAAVKTGAEGYFVAILPERGLGIALKIEDGATRASEVAMATLLVKYGVLDPAHPEARAFVDVPILNRRDIETGRMRAVL